MKVLFVFTGGTIGSFSDESFLHIEKERPYKLIEAYRNKCGIDYDLDTVNPVSVFSENSTGEIISAIVSEVCKNTDKGYDGIIITHGTDTLQYTSAAVSYCMGLCSVPVCLVSSDFPIEDSRSNAFDNLNCALEFIREGLGKGVFAVYKNMGSETTDVHRASRLLAHQAYSSALYSTLDRVYGRFGLDGRFIKNEEFSEKDDETAPFGIISLDETCKSVVRIIPYPGIVYPAISDNVRYIVHESFHSGTINMVSNESIRFFEAMHERNIKVFVTGAPDGSDYDTVKKYDDLHIVRAGNITPISLYMKLWLSDSLHIPASDIIKLSLGGDIIV